MSQIKIFDKATCVIMRDKLNKALAEIGLEGVTFTVGNMSYQSNEVKIGLVATTEGKAQEEDDRLKVMADHLGVKLTNSDGERLVGYKSNNRKYPYIMRKPNGKQYKLTLAQTHARFAA